MARFPSPRDRVSRIFSHEESTPDWEPQRKIIEQAQGGDLEALGTLYDTHINQVYRYALARLGNVHDAEDVAEEIFLKMLHGLPNYEWRKVPFAAWLMRIAHNEVVSFTRRNGRRAHDTELPEELIDKRNNDPAEQTERVMALEDLRKAVALLPEAQRDVIVLRFAAGLSVSDTAKSLGKRENNVKVLQHKGMQRLQLLMTPKYPELAHKQVIDKRNLSELLQECLSAYEAGLSPDECLSAFPAQREELEPLLRQALALRISFAHAPSEEFKASMRERLLFEAGREAIQAFSAEPDEQFYEHGRARLLAAAGAVEQEALRSVPPPHLPFWMNARRRLLEAAAQPRRATVPLTLVLRNGFSAAAVALALTVAIVAFFSSEAHPTSVSAELAQIEAQLDQIDQATAAGQPVQPSLIVELSKRTNQLMEKLNTEPQAQPLTTHAQVIIERQKDIVSQAVTDAAVPQPELAQAQAQLTQADEKVRILAARVDQPTAAASASAAAVTSTTTTPAPATATPEPASPTPATNATAVRTATPIPTPGTLGERQVRISLVPGDTAFGLSWTEVRTKDLHFVIPSSWTIIGLTTSPSGVAQLDTTHIQVNGPETTVLVSTTTAEVDAIVNGVVVLLRSADGKQISPEDLILKTGNVAPQLLHILDSLELNFPPTPTPVPSSTVAPTNTPAPATPAPSATPTP